MKATVNQELGLHTLTIEDAVKGRQRVKLEHFGDDVTVLVLRPLRYLDETSDIETGELMVIVGDRFLLTVRRGDAQPLAGVRKRLEADPSLLARGPQAALYAILDRVVDGYVGIDGEVAADLEEIESDVFSDGEVDTAAIYRLKRENVEIRRAVAPLVGWAHQATDERVSWVAETLAPDFRDIGDHVLRTMDTVESTDNLLMAMLMASTSLQDLQQNRDMRKISAWVAIAAVPTAIAAIYGMNFDDMPELHWKFGYAAVLAFMAGGCFFLYRLFKRSGWL